MTLRFVRRLTTGLAVAAAVCLAPAQSRADVQILVEEYAPGGSTPIAYQFTNYTTAQVSALGGVLSYNFSSPTLTGSATPQYSLGGSVTTNSFTNQTSASLTPSFSGAFKSGFNPNSVTLLDTLRITVTDSNFTGGSPLSSLTNTAAASNGFANGTGTLEVTTQSAIINPLTTPASSTTDVATGPALATTDTSTASLPAAPGDGQANPVDVNNLPTPYAIQQTISIAITRATGAQFSTGATFGGSGGASVDPKPVPAPGGLVLALAGLPLIGLRRVLRKRAPETLA